MLLDDFVEKGPIVIYDAHESRTRVITHLKSFPEIDVLKRPLEIADYLVPSEKGTIAVERKRASDFMTSISDGRIFTQMENLVEYETPRLILEGAIFTNVKSGRCYSIDNLGKALHSKKHARTQPRTVWSSQFFVHPHAFTAIFEDIQAMGIAIIPTGSSYDTADLLRFWATRGEKREHLVIRRKGKGMSDLDRQVFLVSGLPGIDAKRAEALLNTFGTPMRVFNAFLENDPGSFPVEGIGEKTVKRTRKVIADMLVEAEEGELIEYEFRSRIRELEGMLDQKGEELKKMRMPELKRLLKERGLKTAGKKGELLERLLEDMPLEERVDVGLFIKKYRDLLKTKSETQRVPRVLEREFKKIYRCLGE